MESNPSDVSGIRRRFRGYSGARPDVVRMVDAAPRRVLDVGCGAGITAMLIRQRFPDALVVGIEPDAQLAVQAREHAQQVLTLSIDQPGTFETLRELEPFDLIICADVLEHLAEPWEVLEKLVGVLAEGGSVVSSIPNVRHVSTFISLGLLGRWPRRSRGIHDRTHLRFFTRADILELASGAGLELKREARNPRLIESLSWSLVPAKLLDFWPFRAFVTFQYLHAWRKRRRDAG